MELEKLSMFMDKVCRLCMAQMTPMRKIFDGESEIKNSVAVQIYSIVELKICVGDGLPMQICQQCFNQLQASYEFKRQCQATDNVLRSQLQAAKLGNFILKNDESCPSSESPSYCSSFEEDLYQEVTQKCQVVLHHDTDMISVEGSNVKSLTTASTTNVKRELAETSTQDTIRTCQSQENVLLPISRSAHRDHTLPLGVQESNDESDGEKLQLNIGVKKPTLLITNSERFHCTECNKSYIKQKSLTHHMRIHTGKNLQECSICKKSFIYPYQLVEHMRTHTGERPFKCTVCEKAFNHKNDFMKHMRTHTKEKPYGCQQCNKFFSQKGHLDIHMRSHSGLKPYSCPTCNKAFAYKNSLGLHILTHSETRTHTCVFCSKSFPHEKNLMKHVKYHTDAKPYACPTCKKAFFYPCDLESHIRALHTGERPFSCSICNKTFVQKRHLTSHSRIHAEET